MKNLLKKSWIVTGMLVFASVAVPVVGATVAQAQGNAAQEMLSGAGTTGQEGGPEVESSITKIVNILLFLLGVVAVIAIIVGGIMYAVSSGDAGRAKAAKDTIMYAVIGLIVAILAYAIVNFVISSFAE